MALLMQQPNPPLTAAERAARSVFVGNIPYEATEEQLKEIFNQAGPVVSFRLVYDRETGKPKGYGFCEYQDIETAQSAMRNLNNYDFNGRPLRVGVAAGEQNKEEMKGMQQAIGGVPMESPYGEPVEAERAPEAISKAVASLPPEQMFELMKQMKLCIQNNPTEARNMLLQNPQLAYALLQAQIVMKIVDPQVALAMLHREPNQVPSTGSQPNSTPSQTPNSGPMPAPGMSLPQGPGGLLGSVPLSGILGPRLSGPGHPGGPGLSGTLGGPGIGPGPSNLGDMMGGPRPGLSGPPSGRPEIGVPFQTPSTARPEVRDPRIQGGDMRGAPQRLNAPGPMRGQIPAGLAALSGGLGPVTSGGAISSQDQEKAALIMQVLQLTDAQIAVLPPDQRQSILILKDQIAKSAN